VHLIAAKGIAVEPSRVTGVFASNTGHPCPSNLAISTVIGQAIVMNNFAMRYNKPGLELLDNMIWCIIDDAEFQQDSALNAIALAGSWKLSNVCVIYDVACGSFSSKIGISNFKTYDWDVTELVSDENLTINGEFGQCVSRNG
jgi:dihydroxyacetone synthase